MTRGSSHFDLLTTFSRHYTAKQAGPRTNDERDVSKSRAEARLNAICRSPWHWDTRGRFVNPDKPQYEILLIRSLLDPIEAAAIGAVFGEYRSPTDPLYCGSVKANIGHLEGGSGIAGVMKSILILEKGAIPPNAGFERVNPNIKADALNLKVGLSNRSGK